MCERLPDCAHFHVVFTVPEELHDFFEMNYAIASDALFGAASETLKLFQRNNWRLEGGFLAVLHTWGRALNWHPHLHVLVSAGGRDASTGQWRQARDNYLFPVRSMSKVFGSILLRHLEDLECDGTVQWPQGLATLEARRAWRVRLAGRNWNIFSRPTLGNTRAVVRYLARYTSRIAISNQRIKSVDEAARTVCFEYKDYRDEGVTKEMTMGGAAFLRSFARHLVPRSFRRVRYYGLLAGTRNRHQTLSGAPAKTIGERTVCSAGHPCKNCGGSRWRYTRWRHSLDKTAQSTIRSINCLAAVGENRFSLLMPDTG